MTATLQPPTRNVMAEMNEDGDTRLEWDPDNEAEVAAARAHFNKLVGPGRYAAFHTRPGGGRGTQIREFDPDAERIVLVPALQGG